MITTLLVGAYRRQSRVALTAWVTLVEGRLGVSVREMELWQRAPPEGEVKGEVDDAEDGNRRREESAVHWQRPGLRLGALRGRLD